MNDLTRLIQRILFILAVLILVTGGFGLLLLVGAAGLITVAGRYLYNRFILKRPNSRRSASLPHEPGTPAGVPPGPSSRDRDRDYDIIIDPQTNQEYHIPKRKN
ncbi:MAG: hypothetical protein FWF88_05930 [Peptococcaceae bacterium]|nr:hypothetical protein [Peptococcaceae bacterium]